jgi:hypothetical protein
MTKTHPTKDEEVFLNIGYSRFLDLYDETMTDSFWCKKPATRLHTIKDVFSVYTELIQYEPLKFLLENNPRPHYQMVGKDLMKFIRNILFHFPFYAEWSDIVFSKSLILTFDTNNSSIDRFLSKSQSEKIKYRFWEERIKKMTYIVVKIPTCYRSGSTVYLKDIVSEKDGVKFCLIFMRDVLMSQVESISDGE